MLTEFSHLTKTSLIFFYSGISIFRYKLLFMKRRKEQRKKLMKEDISWLRGQQILLGAFKLEKISLLDIPDEFPVNGICLWTQLCAKSERTKVIRQFTQH